MQNGDLSNSVVPRLLVVFEGLLGIPPLVPQKTESTKTGIMSRFFGGKKENSGIREVDSWELNQQLIHVIWDRSWRYDYQFDLITFISPKFGQELKERMKDEDIPFGRVTYENPNTFPRKVAYLPYVAAIYSGNLDHQFSFGGKGRIIDPSNPNSLNSIGRF